MIPQYLKEKSFPTYYKLFTLAVLCISLLPELIAVCSAVVLFFIYLAYNKKNGLGIKLGMTGAMLFAYTVLCLVSMTWSNLRLDSAYTVFIWLCGLGLYLIVFNLVDTKEKIENIVLCLIGSGAASSLVAVVQTAFSSAGAKGLFPSPLYSEIDYYLLRLLNYPRYFEYNGDRASACFTNPLALSSFLVLALPLAVFMCYYASTKKRRIFSIVSGVLIFLGILFTFLRGTVVSVILSLMMLSFAGKKPAKLMSGLAAGSSILMLIVIYLRRGINVSQDLSTNYRIALWQTCISNITKYPLGLGAGSENVRRMLFSNHVFFVNAHNLPLEIVMELGIPGLLVFGALLIFVAKDLLFIYNCGGWYKKYATAFSASIIGFLAMSMFEHTLCFPKEIIYFIIVLACVEATKHLAKKHTAEVKAVGKEKE